MFNFGYNDNFNSKPKQLVRFLILLKIKKKKLIMLTCSLVAQDPYSICRNFIVEIRLDSG